MVGSSKFVVLCFRYVDSPETRQGLVRSFVFNLLRKHWNSWATCDELTVIVFSKEDNIVRTCVTTCLVFSDHKALGFLTDIENEMK